VIIGVFRSLALNRAQDGGPTKSVWGGNAMNRQRFVASLNGHQERTNAVSRWRGRGLTLWMALVVVLVACGIAFAGVTASISGTVKDSTGAVLVGASVTATNTETGVAQTVYSNGEGAYTLPALQPGKYDVEVKQKGFRTFKDTGIELHVNDAVTIDPVLPVGEVAESVTVSADALHAETVSTQLGEVIRDKEMTSVPLNGRSYTDLLALQPGVGNTNSNIGGGSSTSNLFQSGGFQLPSVSGDQNPGNLSVNGMRESANGYLLNGVSVQEFAYSGAAVVPNLDSLAEFRIITNNFDAEYGNFSGGQVNVVTKAGTNQIHGNLFEFWRNTSLDASNFFDHGKRGPWHQNEFGGTLGGPIKQNKVFFFGDYQENRRIVGVSTGSIAVPTSAERTVTNGNYDFSALAAGGAFSFSPAPGVLQPHLVSAAPGTAFYTQIGATSANEPYYYRATDTNPVTNTPYGQNCTSSSAVACIFPGGLVPATIVSQIAKNVLAANAIPLGNGNGTFSTSAFAQNLTDRKGSGRVDANLGIGTLFGYYYIDKFSLNSPYPVATVPGFSAATTGRTQVVNIGDTKSLGSSAVNEARIGYLRVHDFLNSPTGGTKTTLSQLGFSTNTGVGGLTPLDTATEGLPEMDFQSFNIGVPSRILGLVENTYQASDNYSRLIGTHSLTFGGAFHYTQLAEQLHNIENGYFIFNTASETGIDFADFLVGAPGVFQQGQTPAANTRSYYVGAFAQDSWRARPNLTVNYGVRWDVISPWWEQHNEIETLKLGEQSVKFPNSPRGWVFPGDPGIPKTIAPVRWGKLAPRLGLAYSPNVSEGFLGKLFGGPDQTSIRVAYGMFYSAFEGAYDFSVIGDAPYGAFYSSGAPPLFDKPYQTRSNGSVLVPNPFPANFNPPSNTPASAFGVIATAPAFDPRNQVPYAEQYEVSLQRQLKPTDLLTLSYVGTQGHHLLVTLQANPVIPALCAVDPKCVPNGEPTSDRGPFSSHNPSDINNGLNQFGSEGYFSTIGNSSYHSFQVDYRHTSGPLQLLLGYTYSKSLDDASGFGEQVNPFNPQFSRALSAFNIRHNFVVSYTYQLPLGKLGGPKRLVNGWQLSGITTFSSGIPVYVFENDDRSLLGTTFAGPLPLGIDTPSFAGGSVGILNPRKSVTNQYFDTTKFSLEPLGSLGNARRRFFAGPGINNFNMALAKNTHFGERLNLEFRAEFFNIFNHAQFANVQGNINASNFGQATSARDPRIGQLALKFGF
jgi:hypothetical protein